MAKSPVFGLVNLALGAGVARPAVLQRRLAGGAGGGGGGEGVGILVRAGAGEAGRPQSSSVPAPACRVEWELFSDIDTTGIQTRK